MALLLTATVAVGSVSPVTRAFAAGPDEGTATSSEAKRHYEEGTKAFNLGEFPRAIAEFKATYNAKPDPLLLYNIAQSYRLAGDAGQALFFYKSFLRNMPGATNRKEVEAQIRKLEKQLQQQGQADEPKREPVAPMPLGPPPISNLTSPAPPPPTPVPLTPPLGATAIRSTEAVASAQPEPVRAPTIAAPPATPAPTPEINLTTPAPAPQEGDRPIYKKWWFWAGAAGALVIIGAIGAANAKKAPSTTYGTYEPKF
jgi:hypothetical protein